jgi:hypothetical protein
MVALRFDFYAPWGPEPTPQDSLGRQSRVVGGDYCERGLQAQWLSAAAENHLRFLQEPGKRKDRSRVLFSELASRIFLLSA